MLAEVRRTKEEKLALVYAAEYRKRTALKGRDLDQWWENLGRATASANFANVFNTSFPLSSAMEKRWFILFAATIAAGCVVYALQFLTLGNLSAEIKINMLRFTVHARRGEWAALDSSGIGRDRADLQLGLERGGCTTPLNLEELHGTTVEQGPKWTRVTADLHNVTSVDGFFVTTHPTIPDLDPSVFEIEVVRPGEDATWHRVASSRKFVPRDGRIQWLLEPMRTLPDKRGAKVDISLRYPVYAWLRQLASTLIVGLAAALLAWISFMGFYTWGKSVIVATIVITAALHLTEAVMRMTDHNYVGFPLQYATGASLVLFAAAVYRYERYFMESITVTSLVILTCALLEDLWLDPDVLRLTDQVPSIFAALVGMVLIAVRWISKRKAVKAIFEDFATYQRVWDKLVGDSKEVADMKRIPLVLSKAPLVLSKSSIRQEMHTTLPEGYVRHRNSVTALREKSSSDIGRSSALGGVSFLSLFTGGLSYSFQKFNPLRRNSAADPLRLFTGAQAQPKLNRRMSDAARYLARSLTFMKRMGGQIKLEPVMSLRLLYTQAAALHPLVQHKIKGWALHSAGLFPTKSQKKSDATEFVKWSDVSGDLAQEVRIKWATLKKPERAIEKLVRTYGGTVWMVQDLVRQSIVFEKTGELLKCLELIIQDRDVRVIGAKNRLHKAHDSLSTGGYRDVHLNMQLKTPLAHKLGIDQHVFEIQLQLLAYSECKISGGHARYVAFRNALCM